MDKMIHKNEFRLRVLLTNQCDKNCIFCLNDFQAKGKKFASAFDVVDCLRAYGTFMKSIKQTPIVTFAGGEPGLHPMLNYILSHAKYYCHTVKVVTNGKAFYQCSLPYVDSWHVGVTDKNQKVIDFKKDFKKDITVQIVVTDQMTIVELIDMVSFYYAKDIKVKLFMDFFSQDRDEIINKIEYIQDIFPKVSTRFTGKQINRGNACKGCKLDCVTLKALWYFPDNTSSTCPQGQRPLYDDDSWDETIKKAYEAHKFGGEII